MKLKAPLAVLDSITRDVVNASNAVDGFDLVGDDPASVAEFSKLLTQYYIEVDALLHHVTNYRDEIIDDLDKSMEQ